MAKVLMIIAPENYQDKEFNTAKKILEQAGHQVFVASKYKGEATGQLGGVCKVGLSLPEILVDEYNGIIFVGGAGASIYIDDEEAHQIARLANDLGKAIGAICVAPSILANAGILEGKKASVFPSEEENLRQKGAEILSSDVMVDGKIVTASGPYAAADFGYKFLEALNQ